MKKIINSILIFTFFLVCINSYSAPNVKKYFQNEIKTGRIKVKIDEKKINFVVPFNFSEMYPDAGTRRVLYKIFKYIKYFPSYDIQIIGHTDNIPPKLERTKKKYPDLKAYSKGRANSVKRLLSRFGLKSSAIKTTGKGASEPVASNETKRGRAQNRRVEIIVDFGIARMPKEALNKTEKQSKQSAEKKDASAKKQTKSEKKPKTKPKQASKSKTENSPNIEVQKIQDPREKKNYSPPKKDEDKLKGSRQ